MATEPRLICRVKALYPFASNDGSSLKFEPGDTIHVLAQLPSGWWDGLCNGTRGWFPSNYVEIIDDLDNNSLFDDQIEQSTTRTSLPTNWTIEKTEDGKSTYYYNQKTGEIQ
ncbi:SH3 domain-containing protein, partial [Cunninghamella echinulata]